MDLQNQGVGKKVWYNSINSIQIEIQRTTHTLIAVPLFQLAPVTSQRTAHTLIAVHLFQLAPINSQ